MPLAALSLAMLLLCSGLSPATSLAQSAQPDDDDQRVTLLVPAGAGGGTDAVARRLALLLNELLGLPVVVVNRPGRDGLDALDALRGADPDGLTLGLVTGQAMQMLARPTGAVSPILLFNLDPPAWHLRAGDDPGLAMAAVMNGGAQASGGPRGSLWHLALAGLAQAAGQDLPVGAWQPVNGAATAVRALRAGEVRLVVAEAAQGASARRTGEIRTFDPPAPPEVARSLGGWRGLAGPPGLSHRQAEQIAAAARVVAGGDDFRQFLAQRGYTPASLGPAAFARFLATFFDAVARARAALE